MIIKVFKYNSNNKIEFTQTELERLLDEIYNKGYNDGKYSGSFTWTSPSTGSQSGIVYVSSTTGGTAGNVSNISNFSNEQAATSSTFTINTPIKGEYK